MKWLSKGKPTQIIKLRLYKLIQMISLLYLTLSTSFSLHLFVNNIVFISSSGEIRKYKKYKGNNE